MNKRLLLPVASILLGAGLMAVSLTNLPSHAQQRQGYPSYPPAYNPAGRSPAIQGNVQQQSTGAGAGGLSGQAQSDGPENVLILLDASYSMKEKLPSGEQKMLAAKRVILDVIRSLPPNMRVGLRVYGQSANSLDTCRASQLLVPIAHNNRHLLASQMIGIKPTGATPITYALQTAVRQDFTNVPGKKTIILVSDGAETCDADPCDAAVAMMRAGVNVKINVVGFGLTDFDANRQLKCVALSTFGKYYSANTAAELARSMQNSLDVQTAVQGTVILKGTPAGGAPAQSTNPVSPPPGTYPSGGAAPYPGSYPPGNSSTPPYPAPGIYSPGFPVPPAGR